MPDPGAVFAMHDYALRGRGSDCPFVLGPMDDESWTGARWAGFCTAEETGWTYDGHGWRWEWMEGASTLYHLLGIYEVTTAEGVELLVSGMIDVEREPLEDSTRWWALISGTFQSSTADDWTGRTSGVFLEIDHEEADAWDRTTLEGGLGYDDHHVDLIDVVLDSRECDGNPTGRFGLRAPDSSWYDLQLDATCDGCGALSWSGRELARVCPDIAGPIDELTSELRRL